MKSTAAGCLLLAAVCMLCAEDRLPVTSIRRNFFILPKAANQEIVSGGSIRRNGKAIGSFHLIHSTETKALCRFLPEGNEVLTDECYTQSFRRLKTIPSSKTTPEENPPDSHTNRTATPQTEPKRTSPATLTVSGLVFQREEGIYITRDSIRFSRFGSVNALSDYVDSLKKFAPKGFSAQVPDERLISEHDEFFARIVGDRVMFCVVNQRPGYCRLEGGRPACRPVTNETLQSLSDRFHVYILLLPVAGSS